MLCLPILFIRLHLLYTISAYGMSYLFHPGWTIRAVRGSRQSGEIQLEQSIIHGHEIRRLDANHGESEITLNDYWFCTKPQNFVTRCLPDNPHYQLLPKCSQYDKKKFFEVPDLRQAFFVYKLSLVRPRSCTLSTENGQCSIALNVLWQNPLDIDFDYELCIIDPNSEKEDEILGALKHTPDRFVAHEISQGYAHSFNVRCPIAGTYILRLRVGDIASREMAKCCEFKILCETPMQPFLPYPPSHGLGFGFGPHARKRGRLMPKDLTSDKGSIKVKPNVSQVVQTFSIIVDSDEFTDDSDAIDCDYEVELCGSDFEGDFVKVEGMLCSNFYFS